MRGKPAGTPVRLYLAEKNWPGGRPDAGDFLVTFQGRAYSSGYLVLERSGARTDCVKVDPATIPADANVWPMHWTPRGRRKAQGRRRVHS